MKIKNVCAISLEKQQLAFSIAVSLIQIFSKR